jgi:arginine decarboxylase
MVGNRIPKDFFVVSGSGESDNTIHAGSYHLALRQAGIEMCNIMTYSSILPKIAREIERPKTLTHGSVMESILSVCHVNKGEYGMAGLIYGWLYDKKTSEKYGGLVCEIAGQYKTMELKKKLNSSIEELYYNGYSDDYDLKTRTILLSDIQPEKQYGTCLVGLCFINYHVPLIRTKRKKLEQSS